METDELCDDRIAEYFASLSSVHAAELLNCMVGARIMERKSKFTTDLPAMTEHLTPAVLAYLVLLSTPGDEEGES